MPEHMLIIANPASGGGRGRKLSEYAVRVLGERGRMIRAQYTERRGDAVLFAQKALDAGTACVAACGGDGTVHEIAGVLAGTDTALGLLPCGRGNDFARALGIPSPAKQAVDILAAGATRRVDLGKVNGVYFCTVATMGFDSEVARLVYDKAVPFSGTAAYLAGVLKTLAAYRGIRAKLHGDFGTMDQTVLLAATGNTSSYGGGMKIVPDASPEDGLLDVCHARMMSRLQVLRLLPTVFWGGHVSNPHITMTRTRRLNIETDEPVWLFADGEPACRTPAEVTVAEKVLRVVCGAVG